MWIKGGKEGDSMIWGFWLVLFWLHSPYQVYQLVLPTPHPKYIPKPSPVLVLTGTPLVQAVSIFGLAHGHSCLPVLFASTQQTLFYTIGRKAMRNRSLIMLLVITIHSCFPSLIVTKRALLWSDPGFNSDLTTYDVATLASSGPLYWLSALPGTFLPWITRTLSCRSQLR